jgi:hypothetical protein
MKKNTRNTNDTENNIFDRAQDKQNVFHGWWGMPEYSHQVYAYCVTDFYFETDEDLQDFRERTGMDITDKTKSTWYPDMPYNKDVDNRWFEGGSE